MLAWDWRSQLDIRLQWPSCLFLASFPSTEPREDSCPYRAEALGLVQRHSRRKCKPQSWPGRSRSSLVCNIRQDRRGDAAVTKTHSLSGLRNRCGFIPHMKPSVDTGNSGKFQNLKLASTFWHCHINLRSCAFHDTGEWAGSQAPAVECFHLEVICSHFFGQSKSQREEQMRKRKREEWADLHLVGPGGEVPSFQSSITVCFEDEA